MLVAVVAGEVTGSRRWWYCVLSGALAFLTTPMLAALTVDRLLLRIGQLILSSEAQALQAASPSS